MRMSIDVIVCMLVTATLGVIYCCTPATPVEKVVAQLTLALGVCCTVFMLVRGINER